ncbi:uncharacterized protein LOC143634769 [Bidens hawaiensis]|uniref:uncharacterized protein LOC143634769 n=1 Tax=Bidens hawaiensis TaxID=980011 RepID=UPI00404A936A
MSSKPVNLEDAITLAGALSVNHVKAGTLTLKKSSERAKTEPAPQAKIDYTNGGWMQFCSKSSCSRAFYCSGFEIGIRNSENNSSAMKGQRGVCSPERVGAHDKRTAHHNNGKKNNNNNTGGSRSSETAHDSKASAVNESVPMVWPPKFAIGLTNKEKEEDFLAIKGAKLPQRPKKRAKFIQRTINLVSPGGWLCDLTLERYEVREKKITKKRPRGLKAMGGMESESEE